MTIVREHHKEFTIKYESTDEIKDAIFDRLMEFFVKHEAFSGESIMQSDGTNIEAPSVLADIADDIIKFEVEWNDE